jgi:hypothetical protein
MGSRNCSQSTSSKTKKGEMQFGGVIYSDSADKATRFYCQLQSEKNPLVLFRMLPVLWWDLNQNKAEL